MSGLFKKATRKKLKLRMALDGPAGSGKTYTGLRFAFALGKRVAVIDTEHGSASKYQGDSPDGTVFDFDVLELESFAPARYAEAIEEAGRAGYDVILVDSLSHAWDGKDGALEQVDRKGGNSFAAWKDVTPQHRRMVEALLAAPCHVVVTMRSRSEYVMEANERGKMTPRRVGLAPVQRAGMEYEFDLYGSLDHTHTLAISKSRCPAVTDLVVPSPGAAFLLPVIAWLADGTTVVEDHIAPQEATAPPTADKDEPMTDAQMDLLGVLMTTVDMSVSQLEAKLKEQFSLADWHLLSQSQAARVITWLQKKAKKKQSA